VPRLYRPKIVTYRLRNGAYRTPDGKRVTKKTPGAKRHTTRSKKWYGEFRGPDGVERLPLSVSKETAQRMLNKLAGDAELARVNLVDPFAEHRGRPLLEHLEDFRRYLKAKGNTDHYCGKTAARAMVILEGCRFIYPDDLQASRVVEFLADLRQDQPGPVLDPRKQWYTIHETAALLNVSPESLRHMIRLGPVPGPPPDRQPGKAQRLHKDTVAGLLERRTQGLGISTSNDYLGAIKRFAKWLVRDRRAAVDPLAHLSRLNPKTDVRHVRRHLPAADFACFVEATGQGTPFRRLTGADRLVIYCLSAHTGFRESELASLRPASFDLGAKLPTVTVEACYSKHRRQDVQPLRPDVAEMIRQYIAGKPRNEPLWPGSWPKAGAAMVRRDLAAAGLSYWDEDGRVFDFHSLRHTFQSNLAESGVHPKVAQVLARHSSITLTMDHYTHLERIDVAKGLENLPELPGAPAADKRQEKGKRHV
jgi:integrase